MTDIYTRDMQCGSGERTPVQRVEAAAVVVPFLVEAAEIEREGREAGELGLPRMHSNRYPTAGGQWRIYNDAWLVGYAAAGWRVQT